jgi:hypothetical protein
MAKCKNEIRARAQFQNVNGTEACRLGNPHAMLFFFDHTESTCICLDHSPLRCFLNAFCTDMPFMTSSFTRSSASTRRGRSSRTSCSFDLGMMTTPLAGSLKTKSPGVIVTPEIVMGILVAWAFVSAPVPTVEVPLAQI